MVYRIYAEKKKELAQEAAALLAEIQGFLGIPAATEVRILNRYDVENITPERFEEAVRTVFSEPQVDNVYTELPDFDGAVFAVEPLPGQFDQRSDSAEQCIQLMSGGERPLVRAAVYLLAGDLTESEIAAVQKHVVNPVESRLASLDVPETLVMRYEIPTEVETVDGFTAWSDAELEAFRKEKGLAMDADDIACCRDYFKNEERRDPTITEIRVLDTYWSDHCRHTTFLTTLDGIRGISPRARLDRPHKAREPHGHRHDRGEGAPLARHARQARRERGDQRLHREDHGGCGRRGAAVAAAL